jgi:primosomal protein N' (replication factor Y)
VVAVARSVSEHYLSSLGEALDAAIPQRVVDEESRVDVAQQRQRPAEPDLSWLDEYRGGAALRSALKRGRHAAFSWRPLSQHDRGEAIASLVAATVRSGRGALVLLPDVRAATSTAETLRARFGARAAWLGSDRPARERYRAWLGLRNGALDVAVGGRAAVFAPVQRLGLVVIDDESHVSFKERRVPRFHARPVAWQRAREANAVFVAVGVPPSVEAFHAVDRAVLAGIVPPRATELRARPAAVVIDRRKTDDRHTPSARTITLLRDTLARGKRAVLLIHRVGDEGRAIATRAVKNVGAKDAARLDARSVSKDPRAFAEACATAGFIVSSPVLAKDLDLSNVGCVAVVEADSALAVPEFRAAEEAFATWWRAGRWLGHGDTFAIETAQPNHDAIKAITRWDPALLLRAECARRAETGYPPFAALVRIECPAARTAEIAEAVAKAAPDAEILGPIDEDEDRSILVVRSRDRAGLIAKLQPLAAMWRAEGTGVRLDHDPRDVLR